MGRRLLRLYHSLKSPLLLCWCRVLQHQPLRYVSFLNCNLFWCLIIFSSPLFLLGYIPAHNRVYLVDKDMNLYGYSLSLTVVEYQTAVLRGDMEAAAEILPAVPKDQMNKVARFLESRGLFAITRTPTILIIFSNPFRLQGARYQSDD